MGKVEKFFLKWIFKGKLMRIVAFFLGVLSSSNDLGNLMKGTEVGGRHHTTTASTDGSDQGVSPSGFFPHSVG